MIVLYSNGWSNPLYFIFNDVNNTESFYYSTVFDLIKAIKKDDKIFF